MQRLCRECGGIKSYLENPEVLLTDENVLCPFCPEKHRLRRHGWYFRFALLPLLSPQRIPIRRLLCPKAGRTVSLLPDFCIPKRQHGPGILGIFLNALLEGLALVAALRSAYPDASRHSAAQSLRDGFLRRSHQIRAYLAGLFPRAVEFPSHMPKQKHPLAPLVRGLLDGFSGPESGFTHHGYHFHRNYGLGLA